MNWSDWLPIKVIPMEHNTEQSAWEKFVAKGKDAGRSKNIASSAQYFLEAYKVSKTFRKNDSRRGESAYFLGFTRYLENKSIEAARLLNEYLEYPAEETGGAERYAHVHSLLGAIYFGASELDKAKDHIETALKLERALFGESWENHQFLVSILMTQKHYKEAIPHLEFLLKHQERNNLEEAQKVAVMLAFAHKQLRDEKGEMQWQKESLAIRERLNPTTITNLPHPPAPHELPEGWGLDQLSHFIEACRRNELYSFVHKSDTYKQLNALNDRFIENRKSLVLALIKRVDKFTKTKEFSDIELEPTEWLEVYFFLRCHASYSGAVRLAMSAQVPEAFMLLRGCLENALYAWHVSTNSELKDIWLARNENKKAYNLVREKFAIGAILRSIAERNEQLGRSVSVAYNDTIDEGAHPNVRTFLKNAAQRNSEGVLLLSVGTLDPDQVDYILEKSIAIGLIVFEIFKLTYPNLID